MRVLVVSWRFYWNICVHDGSDAGDYDASVVAPAAVSQSFVSFIVRAV